MQGGPDAAAYTMMSEGAVTDAPAREPGDVRRILIVDDEPTILLTLSYALRTPGIEVMTASRLEPAEEALNRYRFDVVIADIRMSGMLGAEGLELLTYIRRFWPQTKVIIMTAYGSDELRTDALNRGAVRYYSKPVDIIELTRELRTMGILVRDES